MITWRVIHPLTPTITSTHPLPLVCLIYHSPTLFPSGLLLSTALVTDWFWGLGQVQPFQYKLLCLLFVRLSLQIEVLLRWCVWWIPTSAEYIYRVQFQVHFWSVCGHVQCWEVVANTADYQQLLCERTLALWRLELASRWLRLRLCACLESVVICFFSTIFHFR